jgi:hypothetical protein
MPHSPTLPVDLLATLAAVHRGRRPPWNARYGRAVARRARQAIRASQRVRRLMEAAGWGRPDCGRAADRDSLSRVAPPPGSRMAPPDHIGLVGRLT